MPHAHPVAATDGFGLELSTTTDAAAHYRRGVRLLLRRRREALMAFAEAVAADADFGLGHAGCAVAVNGAGGGETRRALGRAVAGVRHATRRERQHVEVVVAAVTGDAVRALVLARDHLHEFPTDAVVVHAVTEAATRSGDEALRAELGALVRDLLPAWLGR